MCLFFPAGRRGREKGANNVEFSIACNGIFFWYNRRVEFIFGIEPNAYLRFSQTCLLFAIALGLAALLERKRKEK